MMTKKKRKTLLIVILMLLILIIAATLIILYLNTDLFKSNETLFFKYVGKNAQNIEEIGKIFEKTTENRNYFNESYAGAERNH